MAFKNDIGAYGARINSDIGAYQLNDHVDYNYIGALNSDGFNDIGAWQMREGTIKIYDESITFSVATDIEAAIEYSLSVIFSTSQVVEFSSQADMSENIDFEAIQITEFSPSVETLEHHQC